MATMKQLEKQIATAKKNIIAYQKKIEMYTDRLNKAIDKLNKKGANITVDDIIVTEKKYGCYTSYYYSLPERIKNNFDFNDTHRILNNFDNKGRNEKDLQREISRLNLLKEELEKMASNEEEYKKNTANLKQVLEDAMSDFRNSWFVTMRDWYTAHYNHINSILPNAISRKSRAERLSNYFMNTRGYFEFRYSAIDKMLNTVISNASKIMRDDAAGADYESYMLKKESELVDSWNYGITLLVDKCNKFCLNESAITVSRPEMTCKGFSVIISDGTSKIVDVRVIWAAEYSVLVAPHVRYIATQRKM